MGKWGNKLRGHGFGHIHRTAVVQNSHTSNKIVECDLRFLVDYGTLADLSPHDRNLYVSKVLPLTNCDSQFLLWRFEWRMRWWERILTKLLPFGALALEPGETELRFGKFFEIERIAGEAELTGWPWGFATYLMTRKEFEL